MLFLKKSTPNTINQGRQGLDRKNQDLTVKILKGGRTGLQKFKSSGALKEKGPQPHRGSQIQRLTTRARAVDRAVHPVHGSTVDRPFKTKGYAIPSTHRRSDG
jgi:hypothetical protein